MDRQAFDCRRMASPNQARFGDIPARRIGLWLGCGLLVLAGALVVFTFFHTFYPHVPKANYPPAHDLATAHGVLSL